MTTQAPKTHRAPLTDYTNPKAADPFALSVDTILPLAVQLLAAWSTGDAEQADPAFQELAIATVLRMRAHLVAGTSPIDDAPDFSGSLADAGAALGESIVKLDPADLDKMRRETEAAHASSLNGAPPNGAHP